MRPVTRLLYSTTIFLLLWNMQESSANSAKIHCGNAQFCFPNTPSAEYEYYERMSRELSDIVKKSTNYNITSIPMVEGSPLFQKMTEGRKFLCNDISMTGFLLNEQAKNWTTQCVWNGRDYNGICMPAPAKDSVYYYIKRHEWKMSLQRYREKIGCSAKEFVQAEAAEEQFVCRERCMQAGISYAASMIMIISFCISFMINCV